MAVVGILGAKGGCGASLMATNLGVALSRHSKCLLADLHPALGYDDLLLNLEPRKSWLDLLPVAQELTDRHLDLAVAVHPSGLNLLAGGDGKSPPINLKQLDGLLKALAQRFSWLLLDLPAECRHIVGCAIPLCDVVVLVTTPDPPALRAAKRVTAHLPKGLRNRTGLVLNQIGPQHPAHPATVAESLGLELLADVPPDPSSVGMQVNFGQSCVADRNSALGRAVLGLARNLEVASSPNQQARAEYDLEQPEEAPPSSEEAP